MKIEDVRAKAFAMPLNDPAYPRPPYRFYNREFVVLTYRTDPKVLREVVPEPLEVAGDTVAYEFIRMPDLTGFGDYTETGQMIPVRFKTRSGEVQEGGCARHVSRRQLPDRGRSRDLGVPEEACETQDHP